MFLEMKSTRIAHSFITNLTKKSMNVNNTKQHVKKWSKKLPIVAYPFKIRSAPVVVGDYYVCFNIPDRKAHIHNQERHVS